jgi:hypothetical protein
MRFKILLLNFALLLVSCTGGDTVSYGFDEKKGEVMLTDLYGLNFSLLCCFDGNSKKCGVVFDDFAYERTSIYSRPDYSSRSYIFSGFKDASILSIQVKNENTGNVNPLISYFQDVNTYMAGDTYVPSAMALYADKGKSRSEISFSGFYEGDDWVERDTTVSIGDTLFSNDEGRLDFSVIDRKGHKARLVMNLGAVLKNNDESSIQSIRVLEQGSSVPYVRYYWKADSGSVTFEPIDVNFQYPKSVSHRDYGSSYRDSLNVPFLRLSNFSNSDELILNGGSNKSSIKIPVVNYAK